MRYGLLMKVKNDELFILVERNNYMETIFNVDFKKWLEALKSEMNFIYINQVWTLIDLPERIKFI
jgi:hypothetical protein